VRNYLLPLVLACAIGSLPAQVPAELETATNSRAKALATAGAQHKDRLFALQKTYIADLDRQQALLQAKGDLEGVLAIKKEREQLERPLTAEEMRSLPEALRAGRSRYDQGLAKSSAQERAAVAAEDRTYIATLQALQARLTRAGNIEAAVKVRDALQSVVGGKKDATAVVSTSPPPPAALERPPLVPPPTTVSSSPIAVASEIKAKGDVKTPGPNVLPFSAPKGNGRSGAIGLLIKNPPAANRSGSEWAFNYKRGGTAYPLQIIHPHGRGQFIVHINKDNVGASTPEHWYQVGFLGGDTKRIKMSRVSSSIFPLVDDTDYAVVSRVSPTGAFELTINGQVVATGRATGAEPLSLEIPEGTSFSGHGRGELAFKGAGLPLKWEAGYAGLIVGPMDGGTHVCRDVRYTPAVPAN
jgi:hypothetical protein